MTRLRRLTASLTVADALASIGIASLALGAFLAWAPAGFAVLGVSLLTIARFGTEG